MEGWIGGQLPGVPPPFVPPVGGGGLSVGVAGAAAAAADFLVDWASFFSLSYAMHLSWTFWKVSGWGILRSSERSSESKMAHMVRRTRIQTPNWLAGAGSIPERDRSNFVPFPFPSLLSLPSTAIELWAQGRGKELWAHSMEVER